MEQRSSRVVAKNAKTAPRQRITWGKVKKPSSTKRLKNRDRHTAPHHTAAGLLTLSNELIEPIIRLAMASSTRLPNFVQQHRSLHKLQLVCHRFNIICRKIACNHILIDYQYMMKSSNLETSNEFGHRTTQTILFRPPITNEEFTVGERPAFIQQSLSFSTFWNLTEWIFSGDFNDQRVVSNCYGPLSKRCLPNLTSVRIIHVTNASLISTLLGWLAPQIKELEARLSYHCSFSHIIATLGPFLQQLSLQLLTISVPNSENYKPSYCCSAYRLLDKIHESLQDTTGIWVLMLRFPSFPCGDCLSHHRHEHFWSVIRRFVSACPGLKFLWFGGDKVPGTIQLEVSKSACEVRFAVAEPPKWPLPAFKGFVGWTIPPECEDAYDGGKDPYGGMCRYTTNSQQLFLESESFEYNGDYEPVENYKQEN